MFKEHVQEFALKIWFQYLYFKGLKMTTKVYCSISIFDLFEKQIFELCGQIIKKSFLEHALKFVLKVRYV